MAWLLDTNVWILRLKDRFPTLQERMESIPSSMICVCSVVVAELLHGAGKYRDADGRRALIREFLAPYRSFSFDDLAAAHYADIRNHLEAKGQIIGPNDLFIAAIARSRRLTLVTCNTGEFSRIPGLACEDWTMPQP